MAYKGWYNGKSASTNYAIGYATSDNGSAWTRYASNPVLTKGSSGQWDDEHVKDPWVISVGGQYVMFYAGSGESGGVPFKIGRATSSDGITWSKYVTNPVVTVGAGGADDDQGCVFPVVLYESTDTGREWKMWYGGYDGARWHAMYAYSSDGLSWTKFGRVMTVGTGGQWDDEGVVPSAILKSGTTYYLYYGGTSDPDGNFGWQGGVATFTDPEGTYTKNAGNPVVENRNTEEPDSSQDLSLSSGSATATVEDTSLLNVGEAVVTADANSVVEVNEIASITNATTLQLDHTAGTAYTLGEGARLRPLAYLSVQPRCVRLLDDATYEMFGSVFQPVADLTVSGNTLFEGSERWTAPTPAGPWSYDYSAGLLFTLYPTTSGTWDDISAENLNALGDDDGGTALPEPGIWVDWDQDGFGDEDDCGAGSSDDSLARMLPESSGSGTCINDNITLDVISIEWTRGAASDHVAQPAPGTATIIVKNGANATEPGKYTPENTGSSLYGKLRPGLPVWIGRNADGTLTGTGQTVYGVWAGYVREIVPVPGEETSDTATAQIMCEDPLSYYARQPTKVEDALGRSYTDLRTAVLDDMGLSATRRDLGAEIDTMPISSVDSDSALGVLEEINAATGSRHWTEPGDSKEDWYFYTVRTRHHKLTEATDFTLNADNIQSTAGYRVTADNVNNSQEIEVSPVRLPAGISTIWTYKDGTFGVSGLKTIRAEFEDFVTDAALDYTSSGTVSQVTLANYGRFAVIKIWGTGATINNLTIEGRQVIRDASESIIAEDGASQLAYGRRAGSTVSSDFLASTDLAQGLADFLVWRFKTAHPRMSVDITNLLSTINGRTLYDTVGLTFDRLYIAGKRLEIIGEQGFCDLAASASLIHWGIAYELQETANQAALDLFILDTSVLDGPSVLGI